MPNFNLNITNSRSTGSYVNESLFGSNALYNINTNSTGSTIPTDGFVAALDALDIRALRYPGGLVEEVLDVTNMPDGQIRPEVADFLDWCVENSHDGVQYKVTFVLPTRTYIDPEKITNFIYNLLLIYGNVIDAFEIGNEYSTGTPGVNVDRSVHPEIANGGTFSFAMGETEYGQAANRVINAVQDAIDRLESNGHSGIDPQILIQMAETSGAGSEYNNNYHLANTAIIAELDSRAIASIDGAVVHYYYGAQQLQDPAFAHDPYQVKRIDVRYQDFVDQLGRDVGLFVTEWNVAAGNVNQLGAAGASTILEMFDFLVQMNTEGAFIWPLQHRSPNNIAGNRSAVDVSLSMSGAAFSMLDEALRPRESQTGYVELMESIDTEWSGATSALEINRYASAYRDVIFVSLRSLLPSDLNLNIGSILGNDSVVSIDHLTIDLSTSDGLSDFADANGRNRVARRTITQDELNHLKTLAFFDPSNPNHVTISPDGQTIQTYLPSFEGIIALSDNPQTIEDYYFATESDVRPLIESLPIPGDFSGEVSVHMLPFDVIQIVIDHTRLQEGTTSDDLIIGGIGRDILLGRAGNDVLTGGEDSDKLKGGWGNDILYGGDGSDQLFGEVGIDSLFGGSGNDYLDGGDGNDLIFGGSGDDSILGGLGDDTIWGDSGHNFLKGGGGNDTIFGGSTSDILIGSDGNDTLYFRNLSIGENAEGLVGGVYGGDGFDTLSFAYFDQGVSIWMPNSCVEIGTQLLKFESIEIIEGSPFGDRIGFDACSGTVYALSGDDNVTILGSKNVIVDLGSGDDFLLVDGSQNVTVESGLGNDIIFIYDGSARIISDAGNDEIHLVGNENSVVFVFRPGSGNDVVSGFDASVDRIEIERSEQLALSISSPDNNSVELRYDDGSSLLLLGLSQIELADVFSYV